MFLFYADGITVCQKNMKLTELNLQLWMMNFLKCFWFQFWSNKAWLSTASWLCLFRSKLWCTIAPQTPAYVYVHVDSCVQKILKLEISGEDYKKGSSAVDAYSRLLILSRHENLIVQNSPPDNRIGPKTDKVKSFWSFVSNPPTNILCATECLCAFMSYRCVSARQRTHTCARGFRGCAFLIEAYFGHQVSCMSPDVSKLQREISPLWICCGNGKCFWRNSRDQ